MVAVVHGRPVLVRESDREFIRQQVIPSPYFRFLDIEQASLDPAIRRLAIDEPSVLLKVLRAAQLNLETRGRLEEIRPSRNTEIYELSIRAFSLTQDPIAALSSREQFELYNLASEELGGAGLGSGLRSDLEKLQFRILHEAIPGIDANARFERAELRRSFESGGSEQLRIKLREAKTISPGDRRADVLEIHRPLSWLPSRSELLATLTARYEQASERQVVHSYMPDQVGLLRFLRGESMHPEVARRYSLILDREPALAELAEVLDGLDASNIEGAKILADLMSAEYARFLEDRLESSDSLF